MNLFTELTLRNLIKQSTHSDLDSFLGTPKNLYLGIDPTADALHIGSLMALITAKRFLDAGHQVTILAGGFTASIGDPSGKSQERKTLDLEVISKNTASIKTTINKLLPNCEVVNNLDWYSKIDLISFFRNIGKNFSVNDMLSKDSVKTRLSERDQGISYTEFSYMLFQAYDFMHLAKEKDVTLQLGGQDQWSNIILGCSLTRKTLNKEVHGLTFPLLTKSDGIKFGKTESGTIWISPEKTSPFDFYQFFMKVEDADVINFLKWLTFIPLEKIKELEEKTAAEPEKRSAQKTLAQELTKFVHGEEELKKVEEKTNSLFNAKDWTKVTPDLILPTLEVENVSVVELLVKTGLSSSKSAARRDIEGGGIKIKDLKITDPARVITPTDVQADRLVLKKGKSSFKVIKLVG